MSGAHTQGRLNVQQNGYAHDLLDDQGDCVAILSYGAQQQYHDARRLAACWNALEGISTEDLVREDGHYMAMVRERIGVKQHIRDQAERIRQLEAELEAVGAGGVNGPLLGRQQPVAPTISRDALNALVAADEALHETENWINAWDQSQELVDMVENARVLVSAVLAGVPTVQPAAPQGVAYAPMQGLSAYLRAEAVGVQGVAAETLRQWAADVDAASHGQAPAGAAVAPNCQNLSIDPCKFTGLCVHCIPTAQAAPAAGAVAGPTQIAGVARTFGYWQTHPVHEPLGDHSHIPLTTADKADGWTEVVLAAAPTPAAQPCAKKPS